MSKRHVQPRSHRKRNHNILINLTAKSVGVQAQKRWSFIRTPQRLNDETVYTRAKKVVIHVHTKRLANKMAVHWKLSNYAAK